MQRSDAPAVLTALFDDEGRALLAEGGKPSWEEALAPLPDALFAVPGGKNPGLTLLTLARDLWNRAGDLRMATAATRGLMGIYVQANGTEDPDALVELGALGRLAQRAGRVEEGASLMEQAWTGLRSVVGGRDMRLAVVGGNLGLHYARTEALEDAEHLLEIAYRIRKRQAPETVATVAGHLGEVRLRRGKVEDALEVLRDAWMCTLDRHGEDHPKTIGKALVLAKALNQTQKYRESAPLWRDLHAYAKKRGDPLQIARMGFNLGQALYRTHKKEEAIRLLDDALRLARARWDAGEDVADLPDWLSFRAQIEIDERRPSSAEGIYLEAIEIEKQLSGEDGAATARRYVTLGSLIGRMGRLDEGMGYLDSAASLLKSQLGTQHPWTRTATEATLELLATKIDQVAKVDRHTASALAHHGVHLGGSVLGYDHGAVRRVQALVTKHRL